jgi:hypothetical protein
MQTAMKMTRMRTMRTPFRLRSTISRSAKAVFREMSDFQDPK